MKAKDKTVLNAIESHHWDYPDRLIPIEVDSLHRDGIVAIKNNQLKNVFANKVPQFIAKNTDDLQEKWKVIEDFYGESPYSLWIREPLIKGEEDFLLSHFGVVEERYEGLVFDVVREYTVRPLNHTVITVKDDEHINDLVKVSSSIWGYEESEWPVIFKQRKDFISRWGTDGGFTLAYNKEGRPVGYANYRFSTDGNVLYLNGGGVLPEERNKGIYSSLVSHRLTMAYESQCRLVTCQARIGHSAPILKRLGFQLFSTYQYWVVDKKA